jgi:drug/metabolite transporter (DMT)-like permease
MLSGAMFLGGLAGVWLALAHALPGSELGAPAWHQDIAIARELLMLPSTRDLGLLAILAFGCTLLPFTLSLIALRHLSAYATALAVNLEPVYAILLAIPILAEQQELGPRFYSGACIILGIVFAYPLLRPRTPAELIRPPGEALD